VVVDGEEAFGKRGAESRCVVRALLQSPAQVDAFGAGDGVELPFGGFKRSGYGREKDIEALYEFTQTKTVVVQL
jgi:acyl-CoA reductase-like NAD-dependent aldehyde dehydrogenase